MALAASFLVSASKDYAKPSCRKQPCARAHTNALAPSCLKPYARVGTSHNGPPTCSLKAPAGTARTRQRPIMRNDIGAVSLRSVERNLASSHGSQIQVLAVAAYAVTMQALHNLKQTMPSTTSGVWGIATISLHVMVAARSGQLQLPDIKTLHSLLSIALWPCAFRQANVPKSEPRPAHTNCCEPKGEVLNHTFNNFTVATVLATQQEKREKALRSCHRGRESHESCRKTFRTAWKYLEFEYYDVVVWWAQGVECCLHSCLPPWVL
eukprot:6459055-Amphidinium_carterae.1